MSELEELFSMEVRLVSNADISKWKSLSSEHDCYVKELVSDLIEWYEGNDDAPSFDSYMESKINKREAFIAIDAFNNCLGIIAFSQGNNRITFFGVMHDADLDAVGNALFCHALNRLDGSESICINEITSSSLRIEQYRELYRSLGFALMGDSFENGVPVNTFVKHPD